MKYFLVFIFDGYSLIVSSLPVIFLILISKNYREYQHVYKYDPDTTCQISEKSSFLQTYCPDYHPSPMNQHQASRWYQAYLYISKKRLSCKHHLLSCLDLLLAAYPLRMHLKEQNWKVLRHFLPFFYKPWSGQVRNMPHSLRWYGSPRTGTARRLSFLQLHCMRFDQNPQLQIKDQIPVGKIRVE